MSEINSRLILLGFAVITKDCLIRIRNNLEKVENDDADRCGKALEEADNYITVCELLIEDIKKESRR